MAASRSVEIEILSTEEADVLRAIVQGGRGSNLGAAALIRLNHLRLIMSPGVHGFLPTALGIAWCRTYPRGREPNGSKEKAAHRKVARSKAAKRELIDTGTNKLCPRNHPGTLFCLSIV